MRVVLADDEANVRFALRALLERQVGLQVAGEAASVSELLDEVVAACPDLVLLDWDLQTATAEDLLTTLRQVCPGLRVIVLSGRPETRRTALAAGADAFVGKTDPPEDLLAAIQSVGGN
jgi:DNA-binding NarL/FixJ family response regulator